MPAEAASVTGSTALDAHADVTCSSCEVSPAVDIDEEEAAVRTLQKQRAIKEWHLRQAQLALRIANRVASDSADRVECLLQRVEVLQLECEEIQTRLQGVYQGELNDLFALEMSEG